jgi:DUF4097 and DUF4098 domain-containing protein YvlB
MRITMGVLLAGLVAGAGCVDLVGAGEKYVEREVKHFTTSSTPEINLETFDGSIEVRAWESPEVEVIIERRAVTKEAADTIEVDTSQNGNQVHVGAKVPKTDGFGFHFNYARSAKLIVSAPSTSNLVARSGDGAINVEGISGRVDLRSGDGTIRGRGLGGDVKAHTGDGSIRLDGISGSLDVDTGDGSVVVSGRLRAVRARSGDGSVTIRADQGSTPSADWEIATGDGSIKVELPDGFNADLDARTSDGGVHINDIVLSNVSGHIERNSVRGQLGSGGRVVRLRTGDGSITLSRAPAAERGTF